MIIIRDVPGLTTQEVLDALHELSGADTPVGTGPHITTGYGGLVVDEALALRFLTAYAGATGTAPAVADTTDEAPRPARGRRTTKRGAQ